MSDQQQLIHTREKLRDSMDQITPPHISLPHTPSWTAFLQEDIELYERILELEVTGDLDHAYKNSVEKIHQQTHLFAICQELGIMPAVFDGFEQKPSDMTKYAYEELVFKKHQVEFSYLSADPNGNYPYLYSSWPDKKSMLYSLAKDGILPWDLSKYLHAKIHRLYKEESWFAKMMQKVTPVEQSIECIEVHAFRASLLPVDIASDEAMVDYMRLAVDQMGRSLFPELAIEKVRFAVHIIDSLQALSKKQKDIATMVTHKGVWNGKQYPRLFHAVIDMIHEKGFHHEGVKHVIHEDKQRRIRERHIAKQLVLDEIRKYKPLVLRSDQELKGVMTNPLHG